MCIENTEKKLRFAGTWNMVLKLRGAKFSCSAFRNSIWHDNNEYLLLTPCAHEVPFANNQNNGFFLWQFDEAKAFQFLHPTTQP